MKPTPTDLELVRGLQARSAAAFSRVYADHHAGIYNLCARILDDREEARDVTQDVFIKAFSSPPAAEGEVRLRAWLYRVATNACLNTVRGRRPSGGLAEADNVPAMNDGYEQSQSAALIEQSLGRLNPRYRAALVLKDLHGLGGDELAEVLEVSRPAADVLVHRARASFKKAFAGLAGEGFVAPANLALALPALSVPAALQVLPPLPAALAPPLVAAPGPAPPPAGDGRAHGARAGSRLDCRPGRGRPSGQAGRSRRDQGGDRRRRSGDHRRRRAGGARVAARRSGGRPQRNGGGAGGARIPRIRRRASWGVSRPHDAWTEHRHAVDERLSHADHGGAHHPASGGHGSDGHAGQASHDRAHASSAAASHGGDAHEAAPSTSGTTSATPTHHSNSGGTSTPHEGDGEH